MLLLSLYQWVPKEEGFADQTLNALLLYPIVDP